MMTLVTKEPWAPEFALEEHIHWDRENWEEKWAGKSGEVSKACVSSQWEHTLPEPLKYEVGHDHLPWKLGLSENPVLGNFNRVTRKKDLGRMRACSGERMGTVRPKD